MNRDIIIIDGKVHSWRALCEQRRTQLATRRAGQGSQLVLFAMKSDSRPAAECTAERRHREPTLLCWLGDHMTAGAS